MYFEGNDLKLIEALTYDPTLTPGYEAIKGCLVWNDERPERGMTVEGYEKLCDLWIIRAYIHRGDPTFSQSLDPAYFRRVWAEAQAAGFSWPGFRRMTLSPEDRAYYDDALTDPYGGL